MIILLILIYLKLRNIYDEIRYLRTMDIDQSHEYLERLCDLKYEELIRTGLMEDKRIRKE